MAKTVIINGKTYTERTIDNIVIDGEVVSGGFVSSEHAKPGEELNLDIRVKSSKSTSDFQSSNSGEINNIQTVDTSISEKETTKTSEKESLRKRIINWIIKFLTKFQNE